VTTVREPAAAAPSHAATAVEVPPSCRVSILAGDSHQIDLVLPSAVPLTTLLEPTVIAINKVLRGRGATELPPSAYEFARAAGMTALASDVSLAGHNIADGDVLALVPAGSAERYGPVVENVSTALAQYASDHFVRVTARTALAVAVVIIGAALAVAGGLLWRLRWAHDSAVLVPILFAAATIGLLVTVAIGARVGAGRIVTDGAAWAALVAAGLAAATTPPGGSPGAPHAFLGAATALAGVWLLVRFTGRYWTAAAAIMTAGFGSAVIALVRMYWDVPAPRIGVAVLVAVLVAVSAAPTIALRMANVPRQTFGSITGRDIFARAPGQPEDTISPVEDGLPSDVTLTGEQVAAAARKSNTVLTGVLLGVAAVAVPAAWIAVTPHADQEWAQLVVLAAVAAILILRARAFRDRRHAIILVGIAVTALIGAAAKYGLAAAADDTAATLIAAGAALGIAALGLIAATVVPPRIFSPPVRKVVEYTEYILLALVIPFAAWALGILQYIRYH
jgi:type VII secretion integral membrane protein EccD